MWQLTKIIIGSPHVLAGPRIRTNAKGWRHQWCQASSILHCWSWKLRSQKSFYSKTELINHANSVHEGVKKSKCEFCHEYFSSKAYLKLHNASVHGSQKTFKCDSCDAAFKTLPYLNSHKKRHTKTENKVLFKCELCDKFFTRKLNLN